MVTGVKKLTGLTANQLKVGDLITDTGDDGKGGFDGFAVERPLIEVPTKVYAVIGRRNRTSGPDTFFLTTEGWRRRTSSGQDISMPSGGEESNLRWLGQLLNDEINEPFEVLFEGIE